MRIARAGVYREEANREINREQLLQQLKKCNGCNGNLLPQLCRFKAGDEKINYEPYPKAISYETVRTALEILGMRERRWRKAKPL
jgi:hypothetical protein